MISSKNHKTLITPTTEIKWGQLKGEAHSAFFRDENFDYAQWVIDQGDNFIHKNSRDWIIKNIDKIEMENNAVINRKPKLRLSSRIEQLEGCNDLVELLLSISPHTFVLK